MYESMYACVYVQMRVLRQQKRTWSVLYHFPYILSRQGLSLPESGACIFIAQLETSKAQHPPVSTPLRADITGMCVMPGLLHTYRDLNSGPLPLLTIPLLSHLWSKPTLCCACCSGMSSWP